jgi:diguanylate cyclase (GGDEF)-like protein
MIQIAEVLVANGTGLALLFVLLFDMRQKGCCKFFDGYAFYTMAVLNIIQCILEPLTMLLDGQAFPLCREILFASNSLLFAGNILFAFSWTVFIDLKLFADPRRTSRRSYFVAIPALLVLIGIVINLFTPVFFRISDENVYSRASLFIIPYLVTYFYLILGAVSVFRHQEHVKRYFFLPVVFFLLPIFIGSGVQFLCYGLSTVWLSTAVGMTALHNSIQNELSYVDSLSGLFTRQYLYRFLLSYVRHTEGTQKIAGIMLDLDHFKSINDCYGHLTGDEAITKVGAILRESVSSDAFAVRYAGDEFIVILPVTKGDDIAQAIRRIQGNTHAFNASGAVPYRLTFSVGYTIYDRKSDTTDSFIGRMDQAMYAEKKHACTAAPAL